MQIFQKSHGMPDLFNPFSLSLALTKNNTFTGVTKPLRSGLPHPREEGGAQQSIHQHHELYLHLQKKRKEAVTSFMSVGLFLRLLVKAIKRKDVHQCWLRKLKLVWTWPKLDVGFFRFPHGFEHFRFHLLRSIAFSLRYWIHMQFHIWTLDGDKTMYLLSCLLQEWRRQKLINKHVQISTVC